MANVYYEALKKFISSNPENWKELLKTKPFYLKTVKQVDFNPNWYILVYNLFNSDFDPANSSQEQVNALKACRGCVVDVSDINDVKIVCAPYTKFFNLGEPYCDEIDWQSAKVQLKVDGILIKAFKHNGIVYWATNGSVDPDQKMQDCISPDGVAEDGTKDAFSYFDLLKYALSVESPDVKITSELVGENSHKVTSTGGWCDKIPDGATLMLELVSPRNRIICKYATTKLYFHGYRDEQLEEKEAKEIAAEYGIPYEIPELLNPTTEAELNELLATFDGAEKEGCVVVDKYWRRVKVKSPHYLKIKFIKGEDVFSKKEIFNAVIDETWDDVIGYFPEIKPIIDELIEKVADSKKKLAVYFDFARQKFNEFGQDRKAYAQYVMSLEPEHKTLMFEALKNIPADEYMNNKLKELRKKNNGYQDFENLLYIIK